MSEWAHRYIIGVDGGGTGCRAAIGTVAGGILAQAQGGPANATTDPDLAVRNVLTTLARAASQAGLATATWQSATAHLGLAGVISADQGARIAAALPLAQVVVTDDRATAVTGALGGQDGYLLSVGTGTIVAASKAGSFAYVGGWGFALSDQASGAWLGRAGLQRVLLCHDGLAPHSALTRGLKARFGGDPNAIVAFGTSAAPGAYGALAPDIVEAAREGDPWAISLMQKGADYLMRGLSRLGFAPGDALCLSGGLGPHYAPYLPPGALHGRVPSRGSALDGAFALARHRAAAQPQGAS